MNRQIQKLSVPILLSVLLLVLVFLFSVKLNSSFAQTLICGICPPGTRLAGQPPGYGYTSGPSCQNLIGTGNPNAIYCSFSGSQCTDPVPQPPDCVPPPSPTPTPTPMPQPPTIPSIPGTTIGVGGTFELPFIGSTVIFNDPDSSSWTVNIDYGDGSQIESSNVNSPQFALSHTYTQLGSYTITISITDDQGLVGTRTANVIVGSTCIVCPQGTNLEGRPPLYGTNTVGQACQDLGTGQPLFSNPNAIYCNRDCTGVASSLSYCSAPSINNIPDASINEGDTYSYSGSFNSFATSWTATVDYGDGTGVQPLLLSSTSNSFSLSHLYKDNANYTVTVVVTDNQAAVGTKTSTVVVNNVAPNVGTINTPADPVAVNYMVTASSSFTDPGVLDTHTAIWNWGDGSVSNGSITENNGSGTVNGSHAYATAGVYIITLTVTDKDGASTSTQYQYVVVYDPSAGFLTGSGTYTSQAGSDLLNPSATGKVSWGISAKYQNNNNTPTGTTKFMFKNGDLTFSSTSYSWLVVNNRKAYLMGTGTVNGAGSYALFISAIDGNQTGGQDLVRFQLRDNSTQNIIYDTQPGTSEVADPTTTLTSGSIRVH